MSDYVLAGSSGFLCGLLCWFTLYKLIMIFKVFGSGISEALRND